jgi:hypothetical protein
MTQDLNVLLLQKGAEQYVFAFPDEKRQEVLKTFGRFASNSDLSFTWYDAAVLSKRVRNQIEEQAVKVRIADSCGE